MDADGENSQSWARLLRFARDDEIIRIVLLKGPCGIGGR